MTVNIIVDSCKIMQRVVLYGVIKKHDVSLIHFVIRASQVSCVVM